MAEAEAPSNSYTSSGCRWCKDYQSWINFNEINSINYSPGDARVHHQICQSKFQHIHFFASPLSLDIWLRPTKILPGIGEFLFHSQGPVIGARWQIKHVKPFLRCLFSGPPPPVKQLSSVISSKLLICLQLLTGFCLGPPLCWSQNHEARRVQSVPRQLPQGAFSKVYLFLTVQLCDGLSQLTKLECLRILKMMWLFFYNYVALSFSKVRQFAIFVQDLS